MKKRPHFLVRLLLALVSFVLSTCLFVTAMGAMFILNARSFTDKDTLQHTITQIAKDNTEIMVDLLHDFLSEQMPEDAPISKEQVDAFLAESTITDFIADKVATIVSSAYNGETAPIVTVEEVADQLQTNAELIEKHFEVTVSEENIQEVTGWVEESGILDLFNAENLQNLLNQGSGQIMPDGFVNGDMFENFGQSSGGSGSEDAQVPEAAPETAAVPTGFDSLQAIVTTVESGNLPSFSLLLEAARFLTSDTALFTVIGVSVLLIALLILVNIAQVHLGLIKSGIPVLIAGGIVLLPVILGSVITQSVDATVGRLVTSFFSATIPIGATTIAIGLALIIGGIVAYCIGRSRSSTY